MKIERVGVAGAGTMGNGIAHVFARSGYGVTLFDLEQRFLDQALEDNLSKSCTRGLERKNYGGATKGRARENHART